MDYTLKNWLFKYFNEKEERTDQERTLTAYLEAEKDTFDILSIDNKMLREHGFDNLAFKQEDFSKYDNAIKKILLKTSLVFQWINY